ncbi:hypothetical protein [Antiquaquibacter soli]|uniref:Ig-like domain-containing protein n=1 Tax=Antiquaquibacter soli TaxID=3064523 RepID=A0ABT9BR74_9MICO|nr:hypothetical protein [Protaetiibacter sp. WY-16]MDO7883549.1 hypothetical protein [Protaetiibacter sp. WY-16]
MLKKFTAVLSSLLLAVGLSVIAVAAPASAHHTDLSATAACTSDGGWDVTWTVVNSENFAGTITSSNNAAIPVNTVLPANPQYNTANSKTNTFVQHVTTNASIKTDITVKWFKQSGTVQNSQSYTFSSFPAACGTPVSGTNGVDCTAATIYTNAALKNGDHINMDVVQNGTKFQLNAYVDQRQSQDPASESGLVLRITQKTGPQIVLPITAAQKNSGTFTFTYSSYLTGGWTVEWVQFNSSYFNQNRDAAKFLYCGTQEASAAVVLTDATCDSGQTVAKGAISGATWGELVITGSTYSVTATASTGYSFNGQPTKTFTGTLSPPSSGPECQPVLQCLPKSAVSYTYDSVANSGVITVVNPDPTKYTNDLCDGFWVTATSWKYTSSTLWPQARDVVQKLPKITSVGTYPYVAAVSCGQGDIYASFTAQPDPTANLYGPGNPFPETFLHSMGFTGPNPTWMRQALGCNSTTVVEPTATPITECGTYGSVVVPADTMYIDYTLTGNGQTGINTVTAVANAPFVLQGYPAGGWTFDLGQYYDCPKLAEPVAPTLTTVTECGVYGTVTPQVTEGVDYVVEFDQATGDYTVTATPQDGYRFADDKTEIVFEGNVGAYYECVIDTDASIVYGECTWNTDGTANFREVAITFDNTKSNVDVPFEIPYFPEYNQVVPAGQKVTFSVANIWPAGGGYTVNAGTESFDLTIVPCDEPEKPQPKTRDEVVSSYDCDTTVATVTTTTYTTDWVFDTETATWVEGEEVAGQPVVTTRAMTPEEISTESCLVTVTDPQASTCDVVVDTELTSWIRVELNPNVQYTIDGTVVTEEFTAVEPGAHQVVATALNGYTLQGAQPEPDDWTDTTHTWNFIAVDTSKCEPPTLSQVLPTYSSQQLGCTANGSYTIGAEFGDVTWTVNGTKTEPGTYTVTEPGTVTLVATPTDPTDGFDSAWTQGSTPIVLTFERPAEGCEPPTLAEVLPSYSSTPLTCSSAGSYTIGAEFGDVTWTVDGTETAAGTYPVSKAGSVVIEASPTNEDDTLAAEWTDEPITLTFALPSGDCSTPMLALTGAVASFAPVWAAALLALTGLGLVLLRRKNTAQ